MTGKSGKTSPAVRVRAADADVKSEYTVRSLERGLRVLKCFDVDHPNRTFSEITELTGLHKATCFRLVKTLEDQGFLTVDETTGRYSLGRALLRISSVARSNDELARIARGHLERLAAETGETVDLAVWTPDGVLFIDQVLTSYPFKPGSSVGRIFTDLRNAHAKILVAFGPESRRVRLFSEQVFEPDAGHTPDSVLEEIDNVERRRVAYDIEDRAAGICAVAVPVCLTDGEAVASLAVVAPTERFGPEERTAHTEALKRTAEELCADLG